MILGLNLGGNELPWTHPLVLTMLPLAALFFILFLVVEGKFAKQPILPLYLLSNRTPLVAALVFSFVFMLMQVKLVLVDGCFCRHL